MIRWVLKEQQLNCQVAMQRRLIMSVGCSLICSAPSAGLTTNCVALSLQDSIRCSLHVVQIAGAPVHACSGEDAPALDVRREP